MKNPENLDFTGFLGRATDGIRICPSPEKKGNTGLLRRHFSHSRSYLQAALL